MIPPAFLMERSEGDIALTFVPFLFFPLHHGKGDALFLFIH